MLTIAEEVLLLVLDDDTGKLSASLPVHALRNAVVGRIAQVARLDLIGRSVAHTIRELQDATRGAEAKWLT